MNIEFRLSVVFAYWIGMYALLRGILNVFPETEYLVAKVFYIVLWIALLITGNIAIWRYKK